MTGQLFVVPAETPVDPYVRLVLELADGREVRFRDIRKFGKIGLYGRDPVTGELVTEVGGGAVFAKLGPEPLDPAFSVRDFRRRLRKRSGRLKPLLLDQSFIAGVGNIYADEALWAARLHPLRTAGTLRPADERHLYDEVRRILAEAVVRRGSSIDDYTAPDGDGSMQEHLQVYQRTGEPCPRCGRPVKRIVIGARSTHFCSWCQRLGAADRKGAATILRTMTGGPRRSGGRWTELAGEGTVGLTPEEAARASTRARTERTKRAAATRRAAARASAPAEPTGSGPMSILRLTGVTREVGTFVILDAIDASIALGDRIGLVGPNGAGKTTLLRLAAGRDEPDRGEVHRKRGLTLGLLAQEAHFDEAFMASPDLRTAVRTGAAHLDRMAERLAAMEREERVTDHAYAELLHQYEILGGYTLDQRVESALSGLGFTRDEWAKPPSALSGGEQTRASLARLVIADPDLLLLDEPTNHLDLDALEWLEEHLRRRAGSLLVASHDRAFLDATVDRVWELRDRRLTAFRGDYSAYHRQRIERDARTVKDVDTQAEQIAREKELIQRYRSHRKFSKMHEHEARLERLEAERREAPKAGRKLAIPTAALVGGAGPSRSGEIVVRVEDLAVGYLPGRGAMAADGIAGHRAEARRAGAVPCRPARRADRDRRAERRRQDDAAADDRRRPAAARRRRSRSGTRSRSATWPSCGAPAIAGRDGARCADWRRSRSRPARRAAYLARFLFRGDDAFKEVRMLSGGERSRLELALLGIQPSNLLLLDEPTNHLDIPAREAIEAFMAESPATLLVVSHDRRLLETVCEKLWVVGEGSAVAFDGGYREWRKAVADGWTVEGALRAGSGSVAGRPPAGRSRAVRSLRPCGA